jgi:hypothetical protein
MVEQSGAMPPSGFGWQIGKTAASIRFVADAEQFLASCSNSAQAAILRTAVRDIKDGRKVLNEFQTVQAFLAEESA